MSAFYNDQLSGVKESRGETARLQGLGLVYSGGGWRGKWARPYPGACV